MQQSATPATPWSEAETIDWYLEWGYAEYGRDSWSDDEWQQWAFEQIRNDNSTPATPGDLLRSTGRMSSLPASPSETEATALEAAAAQAEQALRFVLDFGKYNGKTVREVRTLDPGYMRWMATKAWCLAKPELKAALVAGGALDADGTKPVTRVPTTAPDTRGATPGDAVTQAAIALGMLEKLKDGPVTEMVAKIDEAILVLRSAAPLGN